MTESGSILLESSIGFAFLLAMICWTVNVGANIWETSLFLETSRISARAMVLNCGAQTGNGIQELFSSAEDNNNSTRNRNGWSLSNNYPLTKRTYGSLIIPGMIAEGEDQGYINPLPFTKLGYPTSNGVGAFFREIEIKSNEGNCRFCSAYFGDFSNYLISTKSIFPVSNGCGV